MTAHCRDCQKRRDEECLREVARMLSAPETMQGVRHYVSTLIDTHATTKGLCDEYHARYIELEKRHQTLLQEYNDLQEALNEWQR